MYENALRKVDVSLTVLVPVDAPGPLPASVPARTKLAAQAGLDCPQSFRLKLFVQLILVQRTTPRCYDSIRAGVLTALRLWLGVMRRYSRKCLLQRCRRLHGLWHPRRWHFFPCALVAKSSLPAPEITLPFQLILQLCELRRMQWPPATRKSNGFKVGRELSQAAFVSWQLCPSAVPLGA